MGEHEDTALEQQVDISQCEREPVRIPGAVQPHGALLVLDADDLTIVGASENMERFLGVAPRELLGRHVTHLGPGADIALLAGTLRAERVEDHNPFKLRVHEGRNLNALAHRRGDQIIVELEPENDAPEFRASYVLNRVQQSLVRLRGAPDLRALCEQTASEVRQLTGFDRVIVYAFQPDWSGRVVAEDCVDGVARYMDLRFPASDIPSQARALYAECRVRMIPTSTYTPAPIALATDGPALDLTHASLRSISPVHLQYMRNMGVTASMGISIMHGDRLWGLITCNHESGARFVPYEARVACGLLGELVSSLVAQKEGVGVAEARAAYVDIQNRIVQFIVQDGDVIRGLTAHSPSILDVAGATGAALHYNGQLHVVGATPPGSEIAPLLAWLDAQGASSIAIDSLPGRYPPAHAWKDVACGLVAVAVAFADSSVVAQKNWLLWFRPEVVQTVSWGGDPRKQAALGTAGRLHPRTSFDRWREEVHLRSIPFDAQEVAAVESLAADLVDVILEVEASRRIREHSHLLDAAHRQLQLVLDATGDGLVSVSREGRLLAERSGTFRQWFPSAPEHAFVWDVFFADDEQGRDDFAAMWKQLASDSLPFEVCVDQMCNEVTCGERRFELGFKEVRDERRLSSILVTVEDVTERAAARRAAREAVEDHAIATWMLRDARGLGHALAELMDLSRAARDSSSPTDARRALHTLKGNAAVLGLLTLPERCHEVEDRLEEVDDGCPSAADLRWVDEELASVVARVRGLAGEDAFDRVLVPVGDIEGAIARLERGGDPSAIVSELRRWALEPASRQLVKLAARARSVAHGVGKSVEVVIADGNVRVDGAVFAPLWGALAHAVTNAVDHGVEAESVRLARGKPAQGRIELMAEDGGDGWLSLAISDDGGGVDLDAVRGAAERRGLPCATRAELIETLFVDHFSTRGEVSTTSGRGVGLGALREVCTRMGGSVELRTTEGASTELRIRVPSIGRGPMTLVAPTDGRVAKELGLHAPVRPQATVGERIAAPARPRPVRGA